MTSRIHMDIMLNNGIVIRTETITINCHPETYLETQLNGPWWTVKLVNGKLRTLKTSDIYTIETSIYKD